MNRKTLKIILFIVLATLIAAFFILDLNEYITLEYIQSRKDDFREYYKSQTFAAVMFFFFLYVVIAALALPGAAILTILSGALFGFSMGSMIVCPASTIGATISFLISRFLLRDTINNRFPQKIKTVNEGVRKEGAFYLFALRLVPIFPFFMINILMGLTPIRTITFFLVSLIGMLPGTMVYVYAGTELGKISSLSDIASPQLLLAFTLLGLFPIIAKKTLNVLRRNKHEQI